jgi:hypothetical protein
MWHHIKGALMCTVETFNAMGLMLAHRFSPLHTQSLCSCLIACLLGNHCCSIFLSPFSKMVWNDKKHMQIVPGVAASRSNLV